MAIFNTLTRKFALISIIGLSLIAVYIFAAIQFLHHIKGEGAAINLAGQLRFRSFKMAWLVQKITLEGKPENAALLKKGLKDEVAGFEEIIENLQKGSRELQIRPVTKHRKDALLMFDSIVNDWNLIFKPALLEIITLPPPKKNSGL
jgi:nitrate/nitrite-specific signal transduction histidine kinase